MWRRINGRLLQLSPSVLSLAVLTLAVLTLASWSAGIVASAQAEDWPQFRGAHCSGLSTSDLPLPVEVSPDANVIWKTQIPAGHSSPILFQNRVYLTIADGDKLATVALDRATGKTLWEAVAPHDMLEEIHQTGSRAQSTPATDGQIVVSFFGSSGLLAYDVDGHLLWSQRMGPFKNDFGAGSSPIIANDYVILVQDHDVESFIAAYDKRTGKEVWKVDRDEFTRNYATPVIWEVAGKRQIVVAATLRIVGYDLETGEEVWTVRGVSRIVNMSPIIGPDNVLYAACFSPGNDSESRLIPPSVDEIFASDTNQNGTIEESEFPNNDFKHRFAQLDRNKDGSISRSEYVSVIRSHTEGQNVFLAIAPGGQGDITKTHVRWEQTKQLPYCPSPLYYEGKLYMIKNGGIFSVLDAKTGKVLKHTRLKATGDYYASPIAGDGKIYLLNQKGELTVVSAKQGWQELHSFDFGGDGHATPAVADGRLYLLVGDELYCFGLTKPKSVSSGATD